MAFVTFTLDEKHELLIAHYKSLNPNDDVSEFSHNWKWLRTLAAGVTDNDAHILAVKGDLFPTTALGDMLREWAKLRGVTPKGATPARKSAALRVVGVPLTSVPALSELVHVSGLRFKIGATTVVGPNDYVDCDIVAIDVGSKTRLNKGETLTFSTPIANIEETAELVLDIDEDGDDAESDGSLSLRVVSRFRNPPLGGAQEDYVQWAIAETGIARAESYPLRLGNGSVDVAALHAGSGTARILDAPEVAALQALLDKKRPVTVKAFRVLQVIGTTVNVEHKVIPNGEPEFNFDWLDNPAPTAHALTPWDSPTRTLKLSANRPASMQPKGRVIISNGATGKERVIEALSGLDSVILENDPTGDIPDAASTIYSGGPLVQPVRAAIIALFDSLGPANPDAKRYGSWEGNLRPTAIGRVATAVDGVLDGILVTPVATVEATDPPPPNNTDIYLLIPGRILVRRSW